jgi:5-methylthioadenosine/S-adenosylhomocysteine deaminase
MGTITGARALGLDAEIGSIDVGKQADLIAIHTNTPRMTPLITGTDGNLHHNLVHAVQGGDVDMTMVKGKIVVDGGKLLTADLQELIADANKAVPDLFRRRAAWQAEHKPVNALERKE